MDINVDINDFEEIKSQLYAGKKLFNEKLMLPWTWFGIDYVVEKHDPLSEEKVPVLRFFSARDNAYMDRLELFGLEGGFFGLESGLDLLLKLDNNWVMLDN
jgi:hypothetical protein